jgi:hypothetical protein
MDELTRERLDELERLREAAKSKVPEEVCELPWESRHCGCENYNEDEFQIEIGDGVQVQSTACCVASCDRATAEFVAEAFNALPALLRAAREHLDWTDPTPITIGFLRELDFEFWQAGKCWRKRIDDDNYLEFDDDEWKLGMTTLSADITTLGQLRRLLSVLRGAK